ncbi:hypothetical protein LX36DRAFT_712151 [Colletotrichum falcatum]|nr:hypothetical protein LX36DRAFT_712151 [Colletotrichum falcatum]
MESSYNVCRIYHQVLNAVPKTAAVSALKMLNMTYRIVTSPVTSSVTWFAELRIVRGILFALEMAATACGLSSVTRNDNIDYKNNVSNVNSAAVVADMPNVTANAAIRTLEEVLYDEAQRHHHHHHGAMASPTPSLSSSSAAAATWDESWSRVRSVMSRIITEEAQFANQAMTSALQAFRGARTLQRELAANPVSHVIAPREKRLQSIVALYGTATRQVDGQLTSLKLLVDSVLEAFPNQLPPVLALSPALKKHIYIMGNLLGYAVDICEGHMARTLNPVDTMEVVSVPLSSDIGVLGEAVFELRYLNVVGRTMCTNIQQSINIFTVAKHSVLRLGEELKAIKVEVFRLRGYLRPRGGSGTPENPDDVVDQRALWAEQELARLVSALIFHLEQTYFRQEDRLGLKV